MSRRRRVAAYARRQPPVSGGRVPAGASLRRETEARLRADAVAHGVTRSWVTSVILAAHYGIKTQEPLPED